MFTPFVLDWNQHNAGMPFWKTYSSLWNLTSSFQTYAMVFHTAAERRDVGTPATVHICRPLGEAEQCVSAQMKFSYTFSQRHNTDLLYSGGHHLSPGGNMRRDTDDSLALFGERLPRRACYRSLCTAMRVRRIVRGRWTFFIFSGQLSHKCLNGAHCPIRKDKKRKGCCILYLFYNHTQHPLDKYCNSHS